MFPFEIDLATTLHNDKVRTIARRRQTHGLGRGAGRLHRTRSTLGHAMVALGTRLVASVPEPSPRTSSAT